MSIGLLQNNFPPNKRLTIANTHRNPWTWRRDRTRNNTARRKARM